MPPKKLIDSRISFIISDPWEFGTECGTDPFFGVTKDVDGEKVLILLEKEISYRGVNYYVCISTPRHQGKDIADILNGEIVPANMILISTNVTSFYEIKKHGQGKTQAVIGTIEQAKS